MNTKDQINHEASKNPETLEREIDQQRAEIGSTLNALEQKFSPGELFDKALGFARGNGGEFAHNLGSSLKSNPVAALLVGIGVAGLMMGSRRSSADYGGYETYAYDDGISPYDTDRDYPGHGTHGDSRIGEQASHLKEKARHMKANLSESAHERRQQFGAAGQHLYSNARHQAHNAQQSLARMVDDQPLALGAIGIGIGALLGALVPPTHQEDQLLGATADRLKAQASDLARREMATVKEHGLEAGREIHDHLQTGQQRDSSMDGNAATGTSQPHHSTPPPRQPLV